MEPTTLKSLVLSIINAIDNKLKTQSGRLTLIIVSSIAVGGTSVHAWNMQKNNDILEKKNIEKEKEKSELQEEVNTNIKNAEKECNERIMQSAILQKKLQDIYSNKTVENTEYIEQQEKIVKEKEKVLSIQAPIINKLKSLKQQ